LLLPEERLKTLFMERLAFTLYGTPTLEITSQNGPHVAASLAGVLLGEMIPGCARAGTHKKTFEICQTAEIAAESECRAAAPGL